MITDKKINDIINFENNAYHYAILFTNVSEELINEIKDILLIDNTKINIKNGITYYNKIDTNGILRFHDLEFLVGSGKRYNINVTVNIFINEHVDIK